MCGSAPKEARPSAQDIALVDRAVRDNNLAEQLFHPLEIDAVRQATDPHQIALDTMRTQGTTNADIAQAAGEQTSAGQGVDLSSSQSAIRSSEFETSAANAQASGRVDAGSEALSLRDERQLNVARTGLDLQSSSLSGLSAAADRASDRALTKLETDGIRAASRAQAIGTLAGAATGIAIDKEARQTLRNRFGGSASATSVGAGG